MKRHRRRRTMQRGHMFAKTRQGDGAAHPDYSCIFRIHTTFGCVISS
jgi:hypothetical protein